MWRNSAALILGAFALAAVVAVLLSPEVRYARALDACAQEEHDVEVECIFRAIEDEVARGDVEGAMAVFSQAYATSAAFVQTGCHAQAHRVGDIAYYRLYRTHGDITKMDFPQSTTACGYGFFHGFIEHLIQDRPEPAFVDEVCTYLSEKLSGTMRDIQPICYHGSGHGFMLAVADTIPSEEHGSVDAYTRTALAQCAALAKGTAEDTEQCLEGIYNVLVEWMELGQYGFSYDRAEPFRVCGAVPRFAQKACYYEMAQKLDGLAGGDATRLVPLVAAIADDDLRIMSFRVGVAGIVQNSIWKEGGTEIVLSQCAALSDEYYPSCLLSVIRGLYEHGEPQREYAKALDACTHSSVQARDASSFCYQIVAESLRRFYAPERAEVICMLFPHETRDACVREVVKWGRGA